MAGNLKTWSMADSHGQLYLRTPTVRSDTLSRRTGFNVYLKLENLQPPGSFKIRGISHLCQKAVEENGCTHLYCASGGNAGLATAYTARGLGLQCTIVLPEPSPSIVGETLKAMGATVVIHGQVWDDANEYAKTLALNSGAQFIHPFDNPLVWAGHGSMIEEAVEQMTSRPDVIVTCVGGGGLLNGVMCGMKKVGWQDVPVVAMETVGADCFSKSVAAGEVITLPEITSMAICLGAKTVCEDTFNQYKTGTANILSVTVSDKQAVQACLQFADDHRFLVEPACGATLACLYSDVIPKLQREGRLGEVATVLVIVCGGAGVSLDLLNKWKKQFDL